MSDLENEVGKGDQLSPIPVSASSVEPVRPSSAAIGRAIVIGVLLAVAGAWIASTIADRFRIVENVESGPRHRVTRLVIGNAVQNAAVAYGLLGGILALTLGITAAASLKRASWPGILTSGLAGLAIGGVSGGVSSFVATPQYFHRLETADITLSVIVHLAIWCAVGGAAGLAFAIGLGARKVLAGSLIGGIVGGALAVLLFDVCGAFFPLARTERPLAELAETRLAAAVLLGVFVVLGTVIVALQEPRTKPSQVAAGS